MLASQVKKAKDFRKEKPRKKGDVSQTQAQEAAREDEFPTAKKIKKSKSPAEASTASKCSTPQTVPCSRKKVDPGKPEST